MKWNHYTFDFFVLRAAARLVELNNEALYDQSYKWPGPHPAKMTPQISTISLLITTTIIAYN